MQAAQATPVAASSLEARKLKLIQQIAELEDEKAVLLVEETLSEYRSDDELSDEERYLIDERLARYNANPKNVAPFESIYQKLASRRK